MRKHPREIPVPAASYSPYLRAASIVLCLAILAVSTVTSVNTVDTFRLPKEIIFRAEAILMIALAVFVATERDGSWRDVLRGVPRREALLCAAILLWTCVTTIVSTNRILSAQSTITVASAIIIYLATRRLAPRMSWIVLDTCLAAACMNAVFIAIQEYGVWNPFTFRDAVAGHPASTALIGHPDDVGVFLVGPTIAAVIGAYTARGKRRWVYAAVVAVLVTGVVASAARAAMVALLAAALAFALYRPWKQAVVGVATIVAVVAITFAASSMIRERFTTLLEAARQRQYNVLFSERLVPFLTAIDMTRSRPLTGVGPGCFKYHYMDERLALAQRYPAAWTQSWPENFGETHNDHLQVTAETGLPGYALMLVALLFAGKATQRTATQRDDETGRQSFARALRIPLVTGFFVVALAQFPLQIAAPRAMFLSLAAIALAWDPSDA